MVAVRQPIVAVLTSSIFFLAVKINFCHCVANNIEFQSIRIMLLKAVETSHAHLESKESMINLILSNLTLL